MTDKKRTAGRPKKDVTLNKKQEVRCLESEKVNWKRAAEIKKVSVSEYLRQLANTDSKRTLKNQ